MGGGIVMRAAAKVAGLGVLNTGIRGGENPVVSAARQATRSVASVVSSSDDVKFVVASQTNSSSVDKSYEDWEFSGVEDELFMDAGEPMPRLVFGGAPTVQEAKEAASDLCDALEKTYLSDLEHVETLVTKPSKHAIQAFRLLHENTDAQNVVASIASDPNVWNAVLRNDALVGFLETHNTSVVFPEMNPDESKSASESESGKGFMGYVEDMKQIVVDMMTSLSDTFQSLFGGSAKGEYTVNPDGTAGISLEKATIAASFMGLAIMVITVVLLKRA